MSGPALRDDGDPYLAWTLHTGFAGHGAAARDPGLRVPVLLRASAQQRAAVRDLLVTQAAWDGVDLKHVTAFARREDLPTLEAAVDGLELALPLPLGAAAQPSVQAITPSTAPLVMAVIDRGCALLNRSFWSAQAAAGGSPPTTRILALWDQGRPAASGSAWQAAAGFRYGRELLADGIDRQLARLQGASEAQIYRDLDYLVDGFGRLRDSAHGTHVLDTAAGRVDARPPRSSAKPGHADAAAAAPLIFVDVPPLGPGDTTGASPGVFLLDALRYIRLHAGSAEVVVNISLGAFAGPHDGSSMVEQAIDDFITADGHMVVTVAAGNAAQERWHASGALAAAESAGTQLWWRTMPEDPTDSFVELWCDAPRDLGAATLQLQVTPPGGRPSGWLPAQGLTPLRDASTGAEVGAVIGRSFGGGRSGAMFLVVARPTAGARRGARPGLWCIALRQQPGQAATQPVRYDAWIQRDEPAWSAGASVQSFFQSATAPTTIGGMTGSLSSLATGRCTLVVGATRVEDGRPSAYSSQGGRPRRGDGPLRDVDTAASADESRTAVGLPAAGVASGSTLRMGGTSVAAPAAARQIYNALARRATTAAPGSPSARRTDLGSGPLQRVKDALGRRKTRTPEPRHPGDRPAVPLLDPRRPLPGLRADSAAAAPARSPGAAR